ncbi:MAG TPA: hypothetical protein VFS43_40720 [Polyangiaceae bacterium]|nr:hypothetical protein [Polyangiaceae bacterium]
MVKLVDKDKFMGGSGVLTFDGGEPRIDGYKLQAFSVDELRAYADVGLPGALVGYWELTAEQAGELLERAPGLRLAGEGVGS